MKRVQVGAGCWLWTGPITRNGYGQFVERVQRQLKWHVAHRAVYECLKGPIPDGMQLDHVCRNRACVNPAHLQPVTAAENNRRSGVATGLHGETWTRCKRGHEITPANLKIRKSDGVRLCKKCSNLRWNKWYQARKQRAAAAV